MLVFADFFDSVALAILTSIPPIKSYKISTAFSNSAGLFISNILILLNKVINNLTA